jgi:hypothetical protein
MTELTSAKRRSLRHDERGAVMVLGVFMLVIAAGFLYYLTGLGDAIVVKERMQDAADAAAYSGAIVHARGMNALALINILMAAVLAAYVLLKLLSSTTKVAAIAMMALSYWVPPLLGAAKITNDFSDTVKKVADNTVQPAVEKTLKAGHLLAKGVRTATPGIAALKTQDMVTLGYSPVAKAAVPLSLLKRLPVRDGQFSTLCGKAGNYAGRLTAVPLQFMGNMLGGGKAGDIVSDIVADGVSALTTTFSDYYCGDSDQPAEPYTVDIDVAHPELDTAAQRRCRNESKDCDTAEDELQRSLDAFDQTTGKCKDAPDPGSALCKTRLADARRICGKHRDPSGNRLYQWQWYQREVVYRYELHTVGDDKVVVGPTIKNGPLEHKKGNKMVRPPGHRVYHELNVNDEFPQWNLDTDKPVTTQEHDAPFDSDPRWQPGDGGVEFIEIKLLEVAEIDGCLAKHEVTIDPGQDSMSEELKENVPQEMCPCATLGEDIFQIRDGLVGFPKDHIDDKSVLVANFGEKPPGSEDTPLIQDLLGYAGNVALAQAEFYYDGGEERSEWLWHMRWMARMRRFHLEPTGWECPQEASEKEDDDCKNATLFSIVDTLPSLDRVILH